MTRFTFCACRLPPVLPLGETYETERACVEAAGDAAEDAGAPFYVWRHDGVGATWRYVREVEPGCDAETMRENTAERAYMTAVRP